MQYASVESDRSCDNAGNLGGNLCDSCSAKQSIVLHCKINHSLQRIHLSELDRLKYPSQANFQLSRYLNFLK